MEGKITIISQRAFGCASYCLFVCLLIGLFFMLSVTSFCRPQVQAVFLVTMLPDTNEPGHFNLKLKIAHSKPKSKSVTIEEKKKKKIMGIKEMSL